MVGVENFQLHLNKSRINVLKNELTKLKYDLYELERTRKKICNRKEKIEKELLQHSSINVTMTNVKKICNLIGRY